eukprot:scaffold174537_cov18-Tisochrysis_lutea.AAC.1
MRTSKGLFLRRLRSGSRNGLVSWLVRVCQPTNWLFSTCCGLGIAFLQAPPIQTTDHDPSNLTRSSSSNSSIKSEASASSVTHAECLKESCLCMHWMQGQPSPHADTEQQQLSRSAFSSAIRAECRRMLFRGCASFEEALESELRSLKVASAFYRLARHSIWFFSKAQLILLATSELLVRKALLYARSLFAGIDFSSAFSFNIALLSSQCVLNSCDIHSCLIHPVYPCINYGLWFR